MSQRRGRPRLGLIRTAVMSVLQSVGLVEPDGSLAVPSSPVAVADGGTGATTAAGARTALAVQGTAEKGAANGYASLDSGGFVPLAQLPASVQTLLGLWDASTNTPTLADGSGDTGDTYLVSVAGSQDLGSGSQAFEVGDAAVYVSGAWVRLGRSDLVSSVAGKTGVVALEAADLTDATATGLALLAAASAAAARGAISAQEANALLSDIAGLSVSEGDLLYVDGSGDIVNLGAGSDGQVLTLASGVPSWAAPAGGGLPADVFGDGSDGDVVISTNTTLSADMQYDNLTVNAFPVQLNTAGFVIRVRGTLTLNGVIANNGTNASGSNSEGLGGGGGTLFRAGSDGTDGHPTAPSEPVLFRASDGNEPALGGQGGGTAAAPENDEPLGPHTDILNALRPYPLLAGRAFAGGQGGKGGLGDGALTPGGAGGGGGGVVCVIAKSIVTGASCSFRALGGSGASSTQRGGGGGGGGSIIVVANTVSGSRTLAEATAGRVNGGVGGPGTVANGANGSVGNLYLFELG